MAKKVVVTGLNMLTALGLDWEETWKNIQAKNKSTLVRVLSKGDQKERAK